MPKNHKEKIMRALETVLDYFRKNKKQLCVDTWGSLNESELDLKKTGLNGWLCMMYMLPLCV